MEVNMKKMKKKSAIAAVGMMSLWLAACGQTGGTGNVQTEPSAVETVQETQGSEAAPAVEETQAAQTEAPAEPSVPAQTETEEEPEAASSETQADGEYEDNFAVDSEAAAAFGTRIKEAVAAKDLEALADLTAYPVYVGFTDGSVSAASREEFVALGAERIFTPELVESVENADVNSLTPSMAGFVLSADSKPNIIFGVVDGELAIQGINY